MYSSQCFYWIHKCIVLYCQIYSFSLYICTYHINCTYVSICFACKYVKTNLLVHMLNNLVTKLYKLYKLYICSTYVLFSCIYVLVFFNFLTVLFFPEFDIDLVYVFFVRFYSCLH